MPREFQHPFHKLPWLLEEGYDSLEDLEYIDGGVCMYGERPSVLPLWASDGEAHSSHRRQYNVGDVTEEGKEVVAPLIDPRRAVLLPGYGQEDLPVWQRPDPPAYVNGASRTSNAKKDNFDIPKIADTQSPTDSDVTEDGDDATTNTKPTTDTHHTLAAEPSEYYKSIGRLSVDSLRRSSTLTRINEFLQRARSEVFEGEDGMTARERIRHLLRNSHTDDAQR
ncbi:uncharacterized protein LOC121863307 [Homarus americanus]|nr:uncharacterized protein LOC121863307 [Homarus americanus]XP_042217863.1 uncharacterized protein LOC121863307 [Homarus americanus]